MLSEAQIDRSLGSMIGMACGDALGAGYEFQPAFGKQFPVSMIGGGLGDFAKGEWTDDSSMAIVIAQALAESQGELSDAALDYMVRTWAEWALTAPDVGNQTRAVLSSAQSLAQADGRTEISWQDATKSSKLVHQRTGRSGGNGSLMRTAPVALAFLEHDEHETYEAAVRVSELTHFDIEAGEACGLWTVAIQHAIHTGELDLRRGLKLLENDRASVWSRRIESAELGTPAQFTQNGWVVEALQSAWCSISTTSNGRPSEHLVAALEAAVRGGQDTDTVAAIAGSLIGAAYGKAAIPTQWQTSIHGWPGLRAKELEELSLALTSH